MPKHGSVNLYVHGIQKARQDGQPRTSTSTFTQLLNYGTDMNDNMEFIVSVPPLKGLSHLIKQKHGMHKYSHKIQ